YINDPHIELNTKDNFNSDKIKNDLTAKIERTDYRFIKLVLKKGMNVQEYIDTKKSVYSTIDSLRDEYSIKTYGRLFNEIENEIERKALISKYSRFVIIENENEKQLIIK
ncbi:MAG: hypothetical protein Q7W54_15355, partial [Bacteroidota bacterium]|nr:hypothetical protein [Bacteroidota bacterium]